MALAASAGFTSASALLPACSREPCLGAASPPQAMWQQVCAATQPGWRPWRGERLPPGGFRRQRPPGSKTYMEHIVVGHYELFCIERAHQACSVKHLHIVCVALYPYRQQLRFGRGSVSFLFLYVTPTCMVTGAVPSARSTRWPDFGNSPQFSRHCPSAKAILSLPFSK